MKILKTFLAIFFAIFTVGERTLAADMQISVEAAERNVYGNPWDGFETSGIIGGLFAPINATSPPDMVVCIVFTQTYECYSKGTENEPESFCHDSYTCEWDVDVRDQNFGVVVYDIDTWFDTNISDLVDAFIIAQNDSVSNELLDSVKLVMNTVSPLEVELPDVSSLPEIVRTQIKQQIGQKIEFRKSEAQRRKRTLKILGSDQCQEIWCSLNQSTVNIRISN